MLPPDVMIWLGEGAPSVFSPAVVVGSSDAPASGSVVAIDLVAMLDGGTSGLERFFCATVVEPATICKQSRGYISRKHLACICYQSSEIVPRT